MTASASNLWSECNDRTADDRQIGFRSHPSGMRPETNGFSHDPRFAMAGLSNPAID